MKTMVRSFCTRTTLSESEAIARVCAFRACKFVFLPETRSVGGPYDHSRLAEIDLSELVILPTIKIGLTNRPGSRITNQEDRTMQAKQYARRSFRVRTWGVALFLCSIPATGRSAPTKPDQERDCASTYKTAQEREQSGNLLEANRLYSECSQTTCGDPMWLECSSHQTQLHDELASVVALVTDENGEDRPDVQVRMDGKLLTSKLDGRSLTVTPGAHEFSFSAGHGTFASEKITVARGEHNRLISVSLPSGPISLGD
jgi:hypothetical protein